MKHTTPISSRNPVAEPSAHALPDRRTSDSTLTQLLGVEGAIHSNYTQLRALLCLIGMSSTQIETLDAESVEAIGQLGQDLLDNLHAAAVRAHEYGVRLAKGGAA